MSGRAREYYRIATWAVLGYVALYAVALRPYLAWDLPLWLDESWTAVLSSAPSFRSFARQMWLDSNAPLYYLLIWLWPFESNLGLRAPGFIFMLAAAAVAALWRPAGLRREAALMWAFLLLVWQPGIALFLDARYYGLLFLVSTAQTIAYIKLLDEPGLRRATVWTGLATLAILTHYYAAIPAGVQGLYFVWRHRGAALRTWPAALMTLPALAWGVYHLPRLLVYAEPGISWYKSIPLAEVPLYLLWPVGGNAVIAVGVLIIAVLFGFRQSLPPSVLAAVLAAAASVVLYVGVGLVWPVAYYRYLIPVVPAVLLGIAAVVRPVGYLPLALWCFVNLGGPALWAKRLHDRADFGLEKPARLLTEARDVTLMIDYGGKDVVVPAQMEAMLGDAFKRTGRRVEARWTNDLFRGDGLIWFYQPDQAPKVRAIKESWRCHDLRHGEFTGIACERHGRPQTPPFNDH